MQHLHHSFLQSSECGSWENWRSTNKKKCLNCLKWAVLENLRSLKTRGIAAANSEIHHSDLVWFRSADRWSTSYSVQESAQADFVLDQTLPVALHLRAFQNRAAMKEAVLTLLRELQHKMAQTFCHLFHFVYECSQQCVFCSLWETLQKECSVPSLCQEASFCPFWMSFLNLAHACILSRNTASPLGWRNPAVRPSVLPAIPPSLIWIQNYPSLIWIPPSLVWIHSSLPNLNLELSISNLNPSLYP